MLIDELRAKAARLPLVPGVYIMYDQDDRVIYVGKAKKLRNRVSQYFQDMSAHTAKTRLMVSKVSRFDVIIAASEFEALVLECSLIKRHQPKYNILLKDDKGYPYIRLNMKEQYPAISMTNKISDDGAEYFGPYGSRSVTQNLLEAIRLTLKLPGCSKKFPRDLEKGRPCLNFHMNQCFGWCQNSRSVDEYRRVMEQARLLLNGNYKMVVSEIRQQMLEAADALNFELAAGLRDRLAAVETLGQKQLVTAVNYADTDVIGYEQTESKACFTVLHFCGGDLLDKDYELISCADDVQTAVSSLMIQYYLSRGFAPKNILLPFAIDDGDLITQLLEQKYGRKIRLKIPQRGDQLRLVELAAKNAREEVLRVTSKEERISGALVQLGKMIGIAPPKRIEAFDISNISGTDIVASMVVFCNGTAKKSGYKKFKLEGLQNQDDYASMRQVITRRFLRYQSSDTGFDELPDLLLIDGGSVHAHTAANVLKELDLELPVFGMVKDEKHRTRALVSPRGDEIAINGQQSVFSLIGCIQEETHRFAVTYHRQLRSKGLQYSELDKIPGIGPKRKQELLKIFKSLTAIKMATLPELEQYIPKNVALAVFNHFQKTER